MSLAAFTRFLMEKGASPEVIEAVVDYVTRDSVTVTRDKRDNVRDLARERQRRRRERIAAERESAAAKANDVACARKDVTRDERDSLESVPNSLSKEESINEGREEKKGRKKEGTENARARGTRMLTDAPLTDEFREAAIKLGAEPERIPGIWAEFVDFWIGVPGSRGLKCNWLATWRNRVREILSRGFRNGQHRQASGKGRSFSAIALERARAAGIHN